MAPADRQGPQAIQPIAPNNTSPLCVRFSPRPMREALIYKAEIERAFGTSFNPSNIMPVDLQRLPVLTKARLRAAGDDVLAVPRRQVDSAETSGSNSEPSFHSTSDKDRSPREMAFVYDGWSRIGFDENTPPRQLSRLRTS